jgi:hypothetical protein
VSVVPHAAEPEVHTAHTNATRVSLRTMVSP